MNERKTIYRRLLILCLIIALVGLAALSVTRAWFVSGKEGKIAQMGMTSTDIPFELEVQGEIIENQTIFSKINASYQNGEDQSLTPTTYRTSGTYDRIIWRKTGDSSSDGSYEQGIGPNSHGKLTFWVVPKNDGDLNVCFQIRVRGYLGTYDEGGTGDPEELFEITEDMTITTENGLMDADDLEKKKLAVRYLNGHILFFSDYDDATGYYSGFLGTGNTISFADCMVPDSSPKTNYGENDVVVVEKDQKYKVTLYWKWADTLEQILLDSNSPHQDEPLFATNDLTDRNLIYSYLKDSRNYVFRDLEREEVVDYLDSLRNDAEDADAALSELSIAYNNADLLVGYNVDYVMFELTAKNGLD